MPRFAHNISMAHSNKDSFQELLGHIKTQEERNILCEGLEKFERTLYRVNAAGRERVLREDLPESVAHHLEALMAKPPYAEDIGALRDFVGRLKRAAEAITPLRLELAYEPSENAVTQIQEWLRRNIDTQVVLDIRVDPACIGGARVIFNGRYFDGTLGELLGRLFVKKQKELLVYVAH